MNTATIVPSRPPVPAADLRHRLATNLRALAAAAAITPELACARAGMSPLKAQRILGAVDGSTLADLVALAAVLGCQPSDLLAPVG